MNMSILYNKVVCINQDVAEAVRKKYKITLLCLFLPPLHPSRMFSLQLITWIYKLIRQMASDN